MGTGRSGSALEIVLRAGGRGQTNEERVGGSEASPVAKYYLKVRPRRLHLEWSPSRIIQWAGKIGPHCAQAAEEIIKSRQHPEQGYRACLGIMRLSKSYEVVRVEAACHRALALEVCSYKSIKSILKTGKDSEPLPGDGAAPMTCETHHQNVRGKDYYGTE